MSIYLFSLSVDKWSVAITVSYQSRYGSYRAVVARSLPGAGRLRSAGPRWSLTRVTITDLYLSDCDATDARLF